jgi:hypothetical protein
MHDNVAAGAGRRSAAHRSTETFLCLASGARVVDPTLPGASCPDAQDRAISHELGFASEDFVASGSASRTPRRQPTLWARKRRPASLRAMQQITAERER